MIDYAKIFDFCLQNESGWSQAAMQNKKKEIILIFVIIYIFVKTSP